MRKSILLVLGAYAVIGCSSSTTSGSSGGASTTQKTASCVTAGASYIIHYVQHPGGTCGPIGDSVVNTTPDGKMKTAVACTVRNREDACNVFVDATCSDTENGITLTINETGEVKWIPDGSKASGTVSMQGSASDGSTCNSTYDVRYTRQ